MPTDKLTDPKIRQAKPADKPYKLFDGGGLFLLVWLQSDLKAGLLFCLIADNVRDVQKSNRNTCLFRSVQKSTQKVNNSGGIICLETLPMAVLGDNHPRGRETYYPGGSLKSVSYAKSPVMDEILIFTA